jgi:hypothetical protein
VEFTPTMTEMIAESATAITVRNRELEKSGSNIRVKSEEI